MNKSQLLLIGVGGIGLIIIPLTLTSCNYSSASVSPSGVSQNARPEVAVAKVIRSNLSHSLELTAEFQPYQKVDIYAKVTGYVKEMSVDVGDHVKASMPLATLEVPELEEDLKKAEAARQSAEEKVKSAQAEYDQAHVILGRLQSAANEAPNLIAQQDLDTARAQTQAKSANVQAALQQVEEAKANLARMHTLLDYSKITAPFDGVVTHRFADTGTLIQAGTSGSQTMPLVSFEEQKRLRLVFPIPESAVGEIKAGTPVEVRLVSQNKNFRASISRFTQKVDPSTRTMLAEADVDNEDYAITPGIYATVKIILDEKDNVLSIPIQAISATNPPSVLLLNKDNKVEKRQVMIGMETSTQAEILGGLDTNDLVVIGNRSSLEVGQLASAKLTGERGL